MHLVRVGYTNYFKQNGDKQMLLVDRIMIYTLLLTVVVVILTTIVSRRSYKKYGINQKTEIDKAIAVRLRNSWLSSSIILVEIYYSCILISILSTLIVLHLGCFESTTDFAIKARLILYSISSLFTTICPYVVNFQKISNKYRQSFMLIEESLLASTSYGDAINKGEKLISEGLHE
jgi:hypothetical protein